MDDTKLIDVVCTKSKIDTNDTIDVEFKINNDQFNLIAIYRKPSSSRINFLKQLKIVLKKKNDLKNTNLIIVGDLNLNLLKATQDKIEKYDIDKFENLMASFGYDLLINTATREEIRQGLMVKSCLDPIYVRLNKYSGKGYVTKIKVADHYFTIVELWNDEMAEKLENISKKILYKLNHVNIIRRLTNFNWDILNEYSDPDVIYDIIENEITKIYNSNKIMVIKKPAKKTNKQEWMNKHLLEQINAKNLLWSKITKLENPPKELLEKYKTAKRDVKKYISEVKQTFYRNIFTDNTKNSNKIWDKLYEIIGKNNAKSNVDDHIKKTFKGEHMAYTCNKFAKNFVEQVPKLRKTNAFKKEKKQI